MQFLLTKEEIQAEMQQGATVESIAQKYGVSPRIVRNAAWEDDAVKNKKPRYFGKQFAKMLNDIVEVVESEIIQQMKDEPERETCGGCGWRKDGLEYCVLPRCLKDMEEIRGGAVTDADDAK